MILTVILALCALATALGGVYLFVTLKWEIRRNATSGRESLDEAVRDMLVRLEEAGRRTEAAIERAACARTWEPPVAGMNWNKRVQALKLLRRGETVGHVAAAVAVPEKEVELLVRVQRYAAHSGG